MAAALPHPPTLLDLAKAAGLSRSTVSAALLDDHRVSADTREKVQQVARRMGYTRNAFAAALATRGQAPPARFLDVAIVSHLPRGTNYAHCDFRVIKKRLGELGYEGHHHDIVHDHVSCAKLRATLYHQGYRGIIFYGIHESRSEVFSADWSPFSLVCKGRTYHQPPCDAVRSSPFQAVFVAWNEVRRAGYRRIGFVLSRHRPVILDDLEREAALWICQQKLPPDEEAIPPCMEIDDRDLFERWFHQHRPDAVVGFNPVHQFWLREMGLGIPEDVAYANLHHADTDRKVAGVDLCDSEQQIKAAEHLDFLVRHKRTGFPEKPWEMFGPARWVSGESLPARRGGRMNDE